MANCESIVFWSPVPSGSVFKIKAAGDKTAFTIVGGRSRNGTSKPVMPFSDLVPGPAEQVVNTGDRWSFTPVISLFQDVPQAITVEAWVEDGNGTTISLPDDSGAPQPLNCTWAFSAMGGNVLKIFVAA